MIMGMCIGCSPYNAEQSVITQAIAVLRRFGSDAHVYLPGVGMLNGLQAGNYIHSNGTEPGEVDQPVGLVLDAAGSVGENILTGDSATFTSGVGSWVGVGGAAITSVDGIGQVTNSSNYSARADISSSAVAGKTIVFEGEFWVGSGTGRLSIKDLMSPYTERHGFNFTNTTRQMFQATIPMGSGGISIQIIPYSGSAAQVVYFDNISVREVTGIAASQPTTSAKPILRRGAVNLLTYSGDFSNAAWALVGTASKVGSTLNMPSLNDAVFHTATVAATASTGAVMLSGTGSLSLWLFNSTDFAIGLKQITLTSEPTLYFVNATPTVAGSTLRFGRRTGDTATSIIFGGAALFQGTYTAAQIQAIGGIPTTTTAPASTALGNTYWQFDGSNDSLSLGGPLFQMADDHCVIAGGMYSGNNSINNVVASPSQGVVMTSRAGQVSYDDNIDSLQSSWYDGVNYDKLEFSYPKETGFVATAAKRGSLVIQRVGGVQRGIKSATVAFVSDRGSIGAYSGGQNQFTGSIYPVIAIKGTVSDSDLLLLEKWVGSMSGVTI